MKKLSTLLIIVGLLILSIPFLGKAYTYLEQQRLYQQYEKDLTSLGELDAPQDATAPEPSLSEESASEAAFKAQETVKTPEGVIGRIKIPTIKSDLLLLEGSSSKELRYGAGHLAGTAMPGQTGNCAVAGHRNYTFGSYFSRLGEVSPGDEVKLEYNGETFTYIIDESFVVLPTDTYVLKQPTDTEQLTLITCTPKGSNTHRLILRGTLKDNSPESEPDSAIPDASAPVPGSTADGVQ